jgi:hypothetical protein
MIPPAPAVPPVLSPPGRDLRCEACNYGIAVTTPGIRCPMCGGSAWVGLLAGVILGREETS